VIRDVFPPAQAQKVMSQVTIYFGVAPAIAPIIGGWLFVHTGWHSIFWFLTLVGVALWTANFRLLPETLHVEQRQPFHVRHLMRGYVQLGTSARFVLLALASGVPFNGMFLYVLSAPAFLGDHLSLAPTQFFWFFVLTISGIMGGAWLSGRLAGRIAPKRQIRHGLVIMFTVAVLNLAANLVFTPHAWWALAPIAVFSFGWALMVPVVTLLVLDLYPERRGMASSMQAFVGSSANGLVAGVIAPLVMHSTVLLALSSLLMLCIGMLSWIYLHHRWPEIGRAPIHL
jgi:DHA1 family bicyclomycin/chloramphenicol resistance-like MFS transporter